MCVGAVLLRLRWRYMSSSPFFDWCHVLGGLGYLKFISPPERALRWIEGKLNLLGRLPHYVSVDQKTYGRFGVLPTANSSGATSLVGSTQRLGP